MKKLLSVLLAFLLLLASAASAFASDDEPDAPPANAVQEHGYWYVLEQTEDGPAFSYLRFFGDEESRNRYSIYIPKTLGGITLTPENFGGFVFYPWCAEGWYDSFTLDDDNAFFTLIENILYSKDGKTLICFPPDHPDGQFCPIPDGTSKIAQGPICMYLGWIWCKCFLIPGSVTDIAADAFSGYRGMIAAPSGSAAQRFAEANGISFIPLDAEHTHVYFRESVYDCDAETLTERLVCPCGDVLQTQITHFEREDNPTQSCACLCHRMYRSTVKDFFLFRTQPKLAFSLLWFCIRRMIWNLTGTHQFCECGARHW